MITYDSDPVVPVKITASKNSQKEYLAFLDNRFRWHSNPKELWAKIPDLSHDYLSGYKA